MKVKKQIMLILLMSCTALIFVSCKSARQAEPQTAESVFEKALNCFNDKDYLEASQLFDVIKLQYPASSRADDAQFYIAEIHYRKNEFVLAGFQYGMLRRLYPQSEFYKTSTYKTALCYDELSPPYDRDQEYTLKAIQAYSEFQAMYPGDSLFPVATARIQDMRNKLAYRELTTAELYRKLTNPLAASIYFDCVIKDYSDTKSYEPAFLGRVETLIEMKKFDEAKSFIDLYNNKFPNGKLKSDIESLSKKIKK